MEKTRGRMISGWRQVTPPKPDQSGKKQPSEPVAKLRIPPPATVGEKVAGERWESEGGHATTATRK